jgi:hypothetical protein|tara:strand:- start:75 stop:419 length:345 start_codon:yes stop_codon:yes gene_type:complete
MSDTYGSLEERRIRYTATFNDLHDLVHYDPRIDPIRLTEEQVFDDFNGCVVEELYFEMNCKIHALESDIVEMKYLKQSLLEIKDRIKTLEAEKGKEKDQTILKSWSPDLSEYGL